MHRDDPFAADPEMRRVSPIGSPSGHSVPLALISLLFLATVPIQSLAQQPAPEIGRLGFMDSVSERMDLRGWEDLEQGICTSIVKAVLSEDRECDGASIRLDDRIEVVVTQDPGAILHLSASMVGPSPALAGVSSFGFEKHQFALLLVYDADGWPFLVVQNHEPLFNAGRFDHIVSANNPNTRLIEREYEDHLFDLYVRVWNAVEEYLLEQERLRANQ